MFSLASLAVRIRPSPRTLSVTAAAAGLRGLPSARRPLSHLASSGSLFNFKSCKTSSVSLRVVLAGALGTSAYLYLYSPICLDSPSNADDNVDDNAHQTLAPRKDKQRKYEEPLSNLLRTYIVYSICSMPWLVDNSPKILSTLTSIPVLREITEAVVRVTFFAQFVGGESAPETVPVLEHLRAQNMGAVLNFSAEVDEQKNKDKLKNSHSHSRVNKEIVNEIIRCIDAAGDFEDARQARRGRAKEDMEDRKTWVAIKLTALIPDANAFINFSKHLIHTRPSSHSSPSSSSSVQIPFPGICHPSDLTILTTSPSSSAFDLPPTSPLTIEDLECLRELRDELFRVCRRAKERGVVVCVDAEHSWYQPAIEALQLALMREFNRVEPPPGSPSSSSTGSSFLASPSIHPLVYGTFQAYLRRAPEHLEQSLRDAEAGGYALGVKLVRGAYHPLEVAEHVKGKKQSSSGSLLNQSYSQSVESHASTASNTSPSTIMSISPDPLPPVWQTKAETDACFDRCARMLIRQVAEDVKASRGDFLKLSTVPSPRIGLLFGTHNPASCQLVLDALVAEGLATPLPLPLSSPSSTPRLPQTEPSGSSQVSEKDKASETKAETKTKTSTKIEIDKDAARRIAVGQLYGMCDELSSSLASRARVQGEDKDKGGAFVMKYVPYGPLRVVMPYLGRRAIENKSVLAGGGGANGTATGGSAREERVRARREIWRRVKAWFGNESTNDD